MEKEIWEVEKLLRKKFERDVEVFYGFCPYIIKKAFWIKQTRYGGKFVLGQTYADAVNKINSLGSLPQ